MNHIAKSVVAAAVVAGGLAGFAADAVLHFSMRIGGLVLGGVEQPVGIYGSSASSAQHKDSRSEGTGILRVGAVGEYLIFR